MGQPDLQDGNESPRFSARPASQSWERVSPAESPGATVWVWYKPAHAPQGVIVQIPDETYRDHPRFVAQLTMRKLLQTVGFDPVCVTIWHMHGVAYDAMNGTNPYLDVAIPSPVPGVDPSILIHINALVEATLHAESDKEEQTPEQIFKRMKADWIASLELEKELTRLRKRLLDMMGKLKTLNRDLTPPERLYSSNQDRKDWLEARRWLRESSLRLWRFIKECDIGDTSAAGQRNWIEQIYRQYVMPKQYYDGLYQAQRDFETYRKMLMTLQSNMNTALSIAVHNGQRRAEGVLKRIAAKVRDAGTKKNFLGVIID